jgi:alpha-D-xyloside xylohydrolase
MGPVVHYAEEKPGAPLELRVYRGADGAFTLYEDDGNSYSYEKGEYAEIPIAWNEAAKKLTIGARKGSFTGMEAQREFHIVWVGDSRGIGVPETPSSDSTVIYKGAEMDVGG